jgi:hypothetical protein
MWYVRADAIEMARTSLNPAKTHLSSMTIGSAGEDAPKPSVY